MPNPAKKSLVDVLHQQSKWASEHALRRSEGSPVRYLESGESQGFLSSANIAEPYEARRLALEKVAQAAHLFVMTGGSLDRDELKRYLAAVPPLPEVGDG